MTTFEYLCGRCGHIHERAYRHLHPPRYRRCPACGGRARLRFGRAGVVMFRGPGFYATDYRKGRSHDE